MFNNNLPRVFCLMGPTAAGKTALAMALTQSFPMEIVSIDSTLIYRDLNIGSAKPTAEELTQAPHHLIDILDPTETYSAALCCKDVYHLIEAIRQRGNIPLLTGGTMMYFHALQQGLSSLPEADSEVRQMILTRALEKGWAYMHAQLGKVDAVSAARIHPNDTQRIQRALEVFQITQQPLSALWDETKTGSTYQFHNIVVVPQERQWLHNRIARRFNDMLAQGLIAEVQTLVEKWSLTSAHPAMRSVGYRQVMGYLNGEYDRDTMLDKGVAATRQLAKRQLTWLRQWPEKKEFMAESASLLQDIIDYIHESQT